MLGAMGLRIPKREADGKVAARIRPPGDELQPCGAELSGKALASKLRAHARAQGLAVGESDLEVETRDVEDLCSDRVEADLDPLMLFVPDRVVLELALREA